MTTERAYYIQIWLLWLEGVKSAAKIKSVIYGEAIMNKLVYLPIFKANIHYSKGSWRNMMASLKEVYKPGYQVYEYGKEIDLSYSKGTTGRVFVVADNTGTSVDYWFWSGEKPSDDTGYCGWVAHECMHLTTEIMRQVETPLIPETEELYSYLLEYLVTEILSDDWSTENETV